MSGSSGKFDDEAVGESQRGSSIVVLGCTLIPLDDTQHAGAVTVHHRTAALVHILAVPETWPPSPGWWGSPAKPRLTQKRASASFPGSMVASSRGSTGAIVFRTGGATASFAVGMMTMSASEPPATTPEVLARGRQPMIPKRR